MKRVLLLSVAALFMAACAESPTGPAASKKTPSARANHDDIFCESGYVVAFDENGNPICVPDPKGGGDHMRASTPPTPPDSLHH